MTYGQFWTSAACKTTLKSAGIVGVASTAGDAAGLCARASGACCVIPAEVTSTAPVVRNARRRDQPACRSAFAATLMLSLQGRSWLVGKSDRSDTVLPDYSTT